MISKVSLLVFFALLSGCAVVQPYAPAQSTVERKVDRTYTIGQEQSATVGSPLARVKDYYLKRSPSSVVRAEKSFTIFAPPVAQVEVPAGTTANIVGTTTREDGTFRLVILPQFPVLAFLLREDGSFEGSAINRGGSRMGWSYTPNPPDARLVSDAAEAIEASRGYTNFELVYGGASGDAIQILYREYTPQDMARPAFSQQLVYSKASKRIRFRDIQIDVADANNERIVYTVIADGQ